MISVIGGDSPADEFLPIAEAVGREIARRGGTVVCGGRGGIMEAVCRGARAEGGHTIGILPGAEKTAANPHVEFPIATGLGHARNVIVVTTGDAVIALDGAYGTLSEIAHALIAGIPVVGIGSWRIADGAGVEDAAVVRVDSAVEAVECAFALAAARRNAQAGGAAG